MLDLVQMVAAASRGLDVATAERDALRAEELAELEEAYAEVSE